MTVVQVKRNLENLLQEIHQNNFFTLDKQGLDSRVESQHTEAKISSENDQNLLQKYKQMRKERPKFLCSDENCNKFSSRNCYEDVCRVFPWL